MMLLAQVKLEEQEMQSTIMMEQRRRLRRRPPCNRGVGRRRSSKHPPPKGHLFLAAPAGARPNSLAIINTAKLTPTTWCFMVLPVWLPIILLLAMLVIEQYSLLAPFVIVGAQLSNSNQPTNQNNEPKVHVRIGVLLEESDHEQANMFIRTIKMINERKDETIRQLLSISTLAKKPLTASMQDSRASPPGGAHRSSSSSSWWSSSSSSSFAASEFGRPTVEPDSAESAHSRRLKARQAPNETGRGQPLQWAPPSFVGPIRPPADIDNAAEKSEWPTTTNSSSSSSTTKSSHRRRPPRESEANWSHREPTNQQSKEFNIKLEPMIEFLNDGQQALEADEKVCQLIESGVHAIVGPIDGASIQHVQSICDNLEIPYFELRPFLGGTISAPITSVSHFAPSATIASRHRDRDDHHDGWHQAQVAAVAATAANADLQGSSGRVSSQLTESNVGGGHTSATTATIGLPPTVAGGPTAGRAPSETIERSNVDRGLLQAPASGPAAATNPTSSLWMEETWPPQKRRQQQKLASPTTTTTAAATAAGELKRPLDNDFVHPGNSAGPLGPAGGATEGGDGGGSGGDIEPQTDVDDAEAQRWAGREPPIRDGAGDRSEGADFKAMPSRPTAGNNNNADYDVLSNNGQANSFSSHSTSSSQSPSYWPGNNNNNKMFASNSNINNKLEELTLNLYPASHMLTSAYIDMIYALNWTSFAIVYEDGRSMIKLQDLFRESSGSWSSKWAIKLFRHDPNSYDSSDSSSSLANGGDANNKNRFSDGTKNNNNNINNNNNNNQNQNNQNYQAATRSGQSFPPKAPSRGAALNLSWAEDSSMGGQQQQKQGERRGRVKRSAHEGLQASEFAGAEQRTKLAAGAEFDAESALNDDGTDSNAYSDESNGGLDDLIQEEEEDANIDDDHIKSLEADANSKQPPRQTTRHLLRNDNIDNSDTNDNLYLQDSPAGFAVPPSGLSSSSSNNNNNKFNNKMKPPQQGNTFRDLFWRIKLNGELNILLDVKTENLYEALKQAQQVGCMTEEYSYLITSLDLHTIDLEDFKYSRTKITGFSLIQVAKSDQSVAREAGFLNEGTKDADNNNMDDGKLSKLQQIIESSGKPFFDEKYLENLGIVHSSQSSEQHLFEGHRLNVKSMTSNGRSNGRPTSNGHNGARNVNRKLVVSNSNDNLTQNRSTAGAAAATATATPSTWSKWSNEAIHNDLSKREMLQSSPASLGLLPTVDRNNEQRLFDFFLQQQEQNLPRVRLSTSSAILHDSLLLYMLGLYDLDPNGNFLGDHQAVSCSLDSQPWSHGSSMVNYMRQMSFTGLTGPIQFDQRGLRTNFRLDILGMAPNIRLVKIGEWHSKHAMDSRNKYVHLNQANSSPNKWPTSDGAPETTSSTAVGSDDGHLEEVSKSYDELSSGYELELKRYTKMLSSGLKVEVPYSKPMSPDGALLVNDIIFERLYRDQADQIDTLIVTAKLSQPYFMLKETPNKLDGNDQYEGYAVDLIHELSKLVNFRYKWREVADKKYGSKETLPNGTVVWNGMIGEIVRGQADLAIVDLTITAQREEAVDFTLPFMNTGISILFKKPTTKVTTLFSFLSPFSSDVWAYVLAAYCGISAILFLVGHLSPYEWADPHPCRHLSNDDETVLKNQFSLLNSFWFTIGSLMQQGSDLTPRSMSTRTIAGIWYFFTLIMISSYTANLAAFLTVEKVVYPIENVRDLSNQQEIRYGCVESGSTCLFFHDSQIDTYKKINETMRMFKTYVRSNDEGQKRVGEGKFAFFMESTTIEYIIERNCNLTQIGGLIDSKGYGLATSKKSRHKRPYRTLLNEGILHLQETGMLHVLKNRWWKERRGGGTCTDDGKGGGVTELSLANVGGVFVVLLGGLGISFLVAIAEFMWRARRSGSSRDRMCEEMMNDLKFALACKSSTKPNNKTNGRSSRRAIRQQESFLSQPEDLDAEALRIQFNSAQFNPKECDPILLHAMLTMLMQQQQQQQPQTTTGQLTHSMSMPFTSFELPGKHELVNNVIQQQLRENSVVARGEEQQQQNPSTSIRELHHSATLNGMSMGNHHYQPYEPSLADQRSRVGWQQAGMGAEKRRTLHAQQTIDITDDNFPNLRN